MCPSAVVTPQTPTEVAEALADAAERGLGVAPVGGGTALALGNPPERLDVALSLERLTGILAYEPTDLTLSVAAGSRFADVQAVLAEHGQTLPIDVPEPERATIGGLIATALAGPRRYGLGTLRDLLIGISVAHPTGAVSKAGGMVVKNVSGFDLMRLYHGSLGTLAVIVSANFKVMPLPRFESTIQASYATLSGALAAADRVRGSRVRPAALEVAQTDGRWLLAARIEGREETVRLLARECSDLLAAEATTLDAGDSAAWWAGYIKEESLARHERGVTVRLGTVSKRLGEVLTRATELATEHELPLEAIHVSPGLGAALLKIGGEADEATVARFHQWRESLLGLTDYLTVMRAPVEFKRGIDVWGKPPATLDVMRALKQEFDPTRVLNPGRFAGGI